MTETTKKTMDGTVQNLKAILLLGVVVNHAWASSQYITTPQWPPFAAWNFFSNVLIISGLPVFFFLSGYFAPTECFRFFSPEYRTLLRKKFWGLLVPYLLWNALFIVLFLAAAHLFPRIAQRVASFGLESVGGILCSLLGIGRRPIDAPLWFIRDLMLLFLAMPVWNFMLKKFSYWFLAGLWLAGILIPSVTEWYPNYYSICIFCLGIFCRQRQMNLHFWDSYPWQGLIVLTVISGLFFIFPMKWGSVKAAPQLLCVFNALVIPCWLSFMAFCRVPPSGWFSRVITPAAFFLYAAHFLVCSTFIHLLAPRIPDFPLKMAVLYLLFLGAGGGTLLGLFHLMQKFTPRGLSWFIGNRNR